MPVPLRIETGTADADLLGFSEKLFSEWIEDDDERWFSVHCHISKNKNAGNT